MANYAYRRLGNLLVAVSGTRPPLDEEWAGYMAHATALDREVGIASGQLASIAFTDGGTPTGPQRVKLSQLMKGRGVASAVVSDSIILRTAITLVSIINPGIKVFTSKEWDAAATFIRVEGEAKAEVLRVARELAAEVGGALVLDAIRG